MANLTLTIEEETLRRARLRAVELDTSVNALVREYLEDFAAGGRVAETRLRLVELANASTAGDSALGRTWTRDELYEDRLP